MPVPSSPDAAARRDLAACRAILRAGSKSFFAASLLLPSRVRDPATALYAFCRLADDAVDLGGDRACLDRLADRLDRIYRGTPLDHPVDRALAPVVAGHHIPRVLLDALFEGFAWDAETRRYADLDALEGYAVRVAGTVGVMMALLMGVRHGPALSRALDLGVAMQLTNIARDVGEDARAGRLYLPLSWLVEAGIDAEAFLRAPRPSPALSGVVARLLSAADACYRRADEGIAALPAACRPAIIAARRIYAEIGTEVERAGHDSVSRRAVVGRGRKVSHLLAALAGPGLRAGDSRQAPIAAGMFLLDAVALAGRPASVEPQPARLRLGDRLGGVVDIFARLEQRAAPP